MVDQTAARDALQGDGHGRRRGQPLRRCRASGCPGSRRWRTSNGSSRCRGSSDVTRARAGRASPIPGTDTNVNELR